MAPSGTSARVGSYVLGTKLETSKTYEAWQSQHADLKFGSRELLVKRLLPELAGTPRLVEQCALRAERAKRLHHEGIAEVVDVVVEGECCCIVTELLDGYRLRDVMDRVHSCSNALPVWFSLQVGRQIARALDYAHQLPNEGDLPGAIYHQDVSPQNVFLTSTGQAMLVDFGLSRTALLGTNAVGVRRWSDSGEFDLWAPHFGDVQTDILGLARVLYELLAGKPMGRRFLAPSKHAPWVGPEIDHLLARALGLPGPDRFSTMHEFRVALADIIRRQRHQADASHLAGLLRIVMTSCHSVEPNDLESRSLSPRPQTILPAPMSAAEQAEEIRSAPPSSREIVHHRWDAAVDRVRRESEHPASQLQWDAAVDRVRRESEQPQALPPPPDSASSSATDSFEHGLELLRAGDSFAAEMAWQHALELDPTHRLCQINLRLLRKRRDSDRPPSAE